MFLRNATSQIIRFGPFLDSTDGVTPETGLTIAQADMQLSKDGGAYAQKNTAGNATHDADGWYSTTLDATDTATNGELLMQVNVSGALPVWVRYYVVPSASYDALTTDGLNNISAAQVNSECDTAISDAALATAASLATVDSNVDAILVDTNDLQSNQNNWLTATGFSTFNPATDTVARVTLVDTVTANTDMRGTDNALLASSYTAAPTTTQIWAHGTRELTSSANFNDISVSQIFAGGDVDSYSLEETLKLLLSASTGVLSGAATNTITIEAADNSKTRITASVDVDGNRTSVTRDVTG